MDEIKTRHDYFNTSVENSRDPFKILSGTSKSPLPYQTQWLPISPQGQ